MQGAEESTTDRGPEPQKASEALARSTTVEKFARVGYTVHGLLYVLIGVLAAKVALGSREGEITDPPGAIEFVRDQPLGEIAAFTIAVGLAAYALWRLVQAISDPDKQGTSPKGLFVRIGRLGGSLAYGGLAIFAVRLAAGGADGSDTDSGWVRSFLTQPIGPLFAVLVALIILCVAADDVRKACTANFGERFKAHDMNWLQRVSSNCAGRWGFAARSVILSLAGIFLLRAAFYIDATKVKGIEGVLASLLQVPYGRWILGLVALGLASYGLFMMLAARYRHHPY